MMNKKIICIISIFTACLSVLCACGNKVNDETSTTTSEVTYPAPYTTEVDGKMMTAQKLSNDSENYEIGYYDEDGRGVRLEHYKDNKLIYYYISTEFYSDGNATVQKYYDAKGKLVASVNNNEFFDAKGNKITEDEMNKIIQGLE
jgi:uncharacterized protein YkuJ